MCFSAERTYEGNVNAPAAARAFGHSVVVATLIPAGWALADDVAIVISELVTDAVDADASSVEVHVTVHFDHVEIDMTRGLPLQVLVPPVAETVSDTRGIILGALTTDLTTETLQDGRTRTRAIMQSDPEFTTKVGCRFRPAVG
jgi:hypothetical protein